MTRNGMRAIKGTEILVGLIGYWRSSGSGNQINSRKDPSPAAKKLTSLDPSLPLVCSTGSKDLQPGPQVE
jgi:hypothetical protein